MAVDNIVWSIEELKRRGVDFMDTLILDIFLEKIAGEHAAFEQELVVGEVSASSAGACLRMPPM
jgi:hypothetical protein